VARTAALIAAAALLAGCGGTKRVTETMTTTVVTTAHTPAPTLQSSGASLPDVVARVLPSVVNVRVVQLDGDKGEGSGVVLSRDGVIVTNYHVIAHASSVRVVFDDGKHTRALAASVVGAAPERDLAVIHVPARDLTPIRVGHSSSLRLGDAVVAVGFPLDLGGPTVTQGIVSGLNRTFQTDTGKTLEGLLQTDAAINPGNSGGALVDAAGRLVGINTAAARASYAENVGFAISIDEAWPVIQEIRRTPAGQRSWLGISVDSVDSATAAAQLGLDPSVRGAVVIAVYAGSPALKAGLKEGDVITAVGGRPVRSSKDFAGALAGKRPGTRVSLDVTDQLGPRRVSATLVKRPAVLPGG
jgi:S1-C subfamily serine protease